MSSGPDSVGLRVRAGPAPVDADASLLALLERSKLLHLEDVLVENGFDDLDDLVRYPADELEDMMETLTAHGVKRPHANKLRRALENAKAAAGGGGGGAHRHRGDGPPVSPGSGGPDLWQQAEAGMLALGAGLMGAKPTDLSALRGKGGAGAAARFDALDFARYAASCHIVLGHFYQRFAIRGVEYNWSAFAGWGFSWNSFFFLTSGFLLALQRLRSDNPAQVQPLYLFVKRRLSTIWPLYFLTIVLSSWNWPGERFPEKSRWWEVFFTMALLLHAWIPAEGYVIKNVFNQAPTWFLSCAFFNWCLFAPVYKRVLAASPFSILACLASCWAASMVPYLLIVRILQIDIWQTVILKAFVLYNPLMFPQLFVCGVALAKFFYVETAKKDASQIAPYIKYGATCGLAGLGVVLLADMAFLGMLRTEYYLVWRAGGLLPLHCLLLMGLAAEQDPVAKVFKTPMLKHIGEVSYAQYVIQTVVFRSTTQWCIGSEWDRYQVYPFVLYACAYFAHHAVIKVYATLR